MPKDSTASSPPGMFDVEDIAVLLKSSTRHVRRLADGGAMPHPIHIGRLVRWRKADIDQWIAAGCPICRPVKKARAQ